MTRKTVTFAQKASIVLLCLLVTSVSPSLSQCDTSMRTVFNAELIVVARFDGFFTPDLDHHEKIGRYTLISKLKGRQNEVEIRKLLDGIKFENDTSGIAAGALEQDPQKGSEWILFFDIPYKYNDGFAKTFDGMSGRVPLTRADLKILAQELAKGPVDPYAKFLVYYQEPEKTVVPVEEIMNRAMKGQSLSSCKDIEKPGQLHALICAPDQPAVQFDSVKWIKDGESSDFGDVGHVGIRTRMVHDLLTNNALVGISENALHLKLGKSFKRNQLDNVIEETYLICGGLPNDEFETSFLQFLIKEQKVLAVRVFGRQSHVWLEPSWSHIVTTTGHLVPYCYPIGGDVSVSSLHTTNVLNASCCDANLNKVKTADDEGNRFNTNRWKNILDGEDRNAQVEDLLARYDFMQMPESKLLNLLGEPSPRTDNVLSYLLHVGRHHGIPSYLQFLLVDGQIYALRVSSPACNDAWYRADKKHETD